MSLHSAIMYLQNVFVAIEENKASETNHAIFYKFILRQILINNYVNEEKIRNIIQQNQLDQ
jgi:hypothetical protein